MATPHDAMATMIANLHEKTAMALTTMATVVGPGVSDWLGNNSTLLWWLFVASIGSFVLVLFLLPVIVVRLPADHFLKSRRERKERPGFGPLLWRIGKNVLGFVFLLAGIAMLILPGQGLLTLLIGLLMLEFPGKRALERRLVRRPKILAFLNRMRAKRDRPPLRVD